MLIIGKEMGSCCFRDNPPPPVPDDSSPAPQPQHASAAPLPDPKPSPPLNIPKSRTQIISPHVPPSVRAKSVRLTISARSRTLQFSSAAVPIKQLTQRFDELYEVKSKALSLNQGVFTLVKHKLTQIVRLAMKVSRKNERVDEQVMKDMAVLGHLEHPNLLKADTILYDQNAIYVLSEPFSGLKFIDYSTLAENPSEEVIKSIAIQILRGLAYCHAQGHLLKSLSITNIIFFKGAESTVMLKLIAFGVQEKTDNPYSSLKSQFIYKAPEALKEQYSGKADVWSCGVVLYILVTGKVPFEGKNEEQFTRALQERPRFSGKIWGQFDRNMQTLVTEMLLTDLNSRPSAAKCLLYPWFQQLAGIQPQAFPAVMTNLRKFAGGDRLQLALLAFILMHSFGPEDKTPLQEAFAYINTSGSGMISSGELSAAFRKSHIPELGDSFADRVMQRVDFGMDNAIDFAEFFLATANYEGLFRRKKMKTAFDLFDYDCSGSVSVQELKTVLKYEVEEEIWQEFMRSADPNGSGSIGLTEFTAMVRNIVANIRT